MKRNTSGQTVSAVLVSKTDGSAVTTGTTTCYVQVDGGSQAAGSVGSGAATHDGNGQWTYSPAQAETDGAHVRFVFVNSNAVPAMVQVYPSFPQTGDNYSSDGRNGVADAVLLRDWTAISGVGSAPARCLLKAARFLRNKWGPGGAGEIDVYEEDDTTVSHSLAVSTDASADPITGVDPV